MTGHQPNPGVDKTVLGDNEAKVSIEAIVRGVGVTQVRKVNPLNQKATLKAIEELKGLSGVRVLIAEEPCPLFARRTLGKKRVQVAYVDGDCASAKAEGSCTDCLNTLACPAFFVENGSMLQSARDLRVSYRIINYKVKKYGIDVKRFAGIKSKRKKPTPTTAS